MNLHLPHTIFVIVSISIPFSIFLVFCIKIETRILGARVFVGLARKVGFEAGRSEHGML